jgi:quercetin dioxygenase-like cupin family protein
MQQNPSGELIRVGELAVRFLVEAVDSNESVTVFECLVPANARMPAPHSHDGFEETVYGLEGTTTYTIAGEDVELGAGRCVCIPRGTIHAFRNGGDTDAKFLAPTSLISPRCSPDHQEDRRTFRRWARSCTVTVLHRLRLPGAEVQLPAARGSAR